MTRWSLKKLVYLLHVVFVIAISEVAGKQTRPSPLTLEQKRSLHRFLHEHLSDTELTEKDIKPVVATGDPAIPHLVKARPAKVQKISVTGVVLEYDFLKGGYGPQIDKLNKFIVENNYKPTAKCQFILILSLKEMENEGYSGRGCSI
jgi:hypothetical protein